MLYAVSLAGTPCMEDPDHYLPAGPPPDPAPWFAELWLGGWDADALSGYLLGSLAFEVGAEPRARVAAPGTALTGFAPPSRTVPRRP
jgi:hypothetical protein